MTPLEAPIAFEPLYQERVWGGRSLGELGTRRLGAQEGDVEWECVAATRQAMIYERGPHHLRMTTDDGRQLVGDVVLVRSHDRGHVFRGVGALDGLGDDELGD